MADRTPRLKAHFLHVGKTGGTAIKHALSGQEETGTYRLVGHPHATRLHDVPAGEKLFFFLREPLARFVSGFYSRQRQGRPRYHTPWSTGEGIAFAAFPTAGALAEALSDADPARRAAARTAMGEIQHVRDFYHSWFGEPGDIDARLGDLLFVGFQETLARDFEDLKRVLGLDPALRLPTDPVEAHRLPQGFDIHLSELARRNLALHYAQDIQFYERMRARAAT